MEQAQRGVSEDARVASRERAEPIGAYLARQRVLRGITLEGLAETTRIPVRSLARLEAGVFDAAPDGFARGFVRTVALALGLPPDETVARMLPEADADERTRGRLRIWFQRALGAAALGVAILAAIWTVTGRQLLPSGWSGDGDQIVYRRDAIRALAEQQHATVPPASEPPAPEAR
jgi:hypothetical protein